MAQDHGRQALVSSEHPGIAEQEDAVRTLLAGIGEDPSRSGLQDTPARFVRAFQELTEGYAQDPAEILGRTFEEGYEAPVSVTGIPFWSLCEHHLLPFHGRADITYVPNGKVVGLSKLSRLVQCFARRLQMQERMTRQVADALETHLGAVGVSVTIHGEHTCMAARGIRTAATMRTCIERGVLAPATPDTGAARVRLPQRGAAKDPRGVHDLRHAAVAPGADGNGIH